MSPNRGDSIRPWILKWSCISNHPHVSPRSNICARDRCGDDQPTSNCSSDAVFTQKPSTCERSFASGFDVDANSAMGNHLLIVEFRWRRLALRRLAHVTQAAWQAVIDMWQKTSYRIAQTECTHPPELRVRRANQWASMDICDRKRGGCGAILNHSLTAMACAQRNAKVKVKAKKKDSVNINQRAALIASGALDEKEWDNVCPRQPRGLCVPDRRRTDYTLSRMGPHWDAVYIDQGVSRRGCQFQRHKYQPYRRWKFGDWFWWPVRRSTRRLGDEYVAQTRRWIPKSNSQQRLDGSDASPDVKPRVGARTIRSVAAHSSTIPTPSVPAAARCVIQPGIVADVPSPQRERQVHWGPIEHGYANGLDWCVNVQSDTRTDVCNHESSRCVEAEPIFEIRGEALSVLPQFVVEHPF